MATKAEMALEVISEEQMGQLIGLTSRIEDAYPYISYPSFGALISGYSSHVEILCEPTSQG